jgi:thiamine pyrophosphate-dependent acetolactate synthase large subunit-like protein
MPSFPQTRKSRIGLGAGSACPGLDPGSGMTTIELFPCRESCMRVADYVTEVLAIEGVKFVSAFPGDDLLPLFDAFYQRPEIPLIITRHEQATVFMADGYARSCGEPGVAVVTQGPGRCNALAAIVNAFTDSVPLVVLFGHNTLKLSGKGMLQEAPYLESFIPMSKWAFSIPGPERVPEALRRAFTLARSGRPGPVILEIPEDVLAADIEEGPCSKSRPVRFAADPADVATAFEMLKASRCPLIYAGRGALAAGASAELKALAETFSIPVMTSLVAKGAIPEDHPLCLGLGGYPRALYGTPMAAEYARRADLVMALGCSFRQFATSLWLPKPPEAKLIQVDVDPAELHKNYRADLAVLSDTRLFLQALLGKATEALDRWRKGIGGEVTGEIRRLKGQWLASWEHRLRSDEVPLNPYRVCWDLGRLLDRCNTILLHDAGTTRAYIAHHYETLFANGFLGFGNTSAMGWSTPAAMGVKLAHPEKTVVNVTGDGSFGMTGMEIETAARNRIPILTVILNNESLNASRERQAARFGSREIGVRQGGDYAALAQALGAHGERVERPEDLKMALDRALRHQGPSVLDVIVKPLEPRP